MKLRPLVLFLGFILQGPSLSSELTPDLSKLSPVRPNEMLTAVPEVNDVLLKETFGHDLSKLPLPLNNFLLAVSLEKVTPNSLTFFEPVGIPYITEKGDDYWILKYINGDRELSTLLNLTILFSVTYKPYFSDKPELDLDTMQHNLLLSLEEKGYWPASYLLAEQSLLLATADKEVINIYQDRMIACAEVNFIPCQLRIGIAMTNSEHYEAAAPMLTNALSIYFNDQRYQSQDLEAVIMTLSILTEKVMSNFLPIEQTQIYRKKLSELTKIALINPP